MKYELQEIPIGKVQPNPRQPRERFDREEIQELADSLASVDVIQPIIVRKFKGGYQIIAGERRWRAAQFSKLDKIPALVKEDGRDEIDILLESVIENLHRKDLTSTERENALHELWTSGKWKSYGELAKRLGKSDEWVGANIEAASVRKKTRISEKVSTRVIASTAGLEEDERKAILKRVDKGEIAPEKVRDAVQVMMKAPESLKKAVLKDEVTFERAKEAVEIFEKAGRVGREIPEKEIKRHVEQLRMDAKEDRLREAVRKKSEEAVLTGKKKSVGVVFDAGKANKFLNQVEDVTWTVTAWGVPTMMVVGEKAWNQARRNFKKIHDHMEFLLGKEFVREHRRLEE